VINIKVLLLLLLLLLLLGEQYRLTLQYRLTVRLKGALPLNYTA
jgi:hypothetical protein